MYKKLFFLWLLIFTPNVQAEGFTLSSTDVQGQLGNEQVFDGFGCDGRNLSPQLHWTNAPAGTKSFAVTVYDPDAPTGSGWWHWVVFNINKSVDGFKTGASGKTMPAGAIESSNSYSLQSYGGACPPAGDKPHRYIFTVYALDIEKIEQSSTAVPELMGFYINSHTLAKASIIAYFGR